jgi:arylsulfatase A-like enzyme
MVKNVMLIFFVAMLSLVAERPNIVLIFVDDQGYQDLGCFGSPNLKTPHIDELAKNGAKFTNFHVASSVCSPSRASLLTGRYPERTGITGVLFPRHDIGLHPREYTIAEMLKDNGYKTAAVGKWHLGHKKSFLPTNQGFQSYYGIPYSNDMKHDTTMELAENCLFLEGKDAQFFKTSEGVKDFVPLMQDDKVIEYPCDQNTITKRFTDKSIEFIEKNQNKPFFLYLAHSMPHVPLYVTKEFEGKSEQGLYGDCIEEIDHNVGRLVQKLKDLKIFDKTLIVYTTDNGPWHFKANATDKVKGNMNRRTGGSAAPLRGYKFSDFEGGMRVPCVMSWPDKIPAGMVNNELASTIDLFPTFAKLTGSKIKMKRFIDGKDISTLLQSSEAKSPRELYHLRSKAVIDGEWKYITNTRDYEVGGKKGSSKNLLFNLRNDREEKVNLAEEYPAKVAKYQEIIEAHKLQVKVDASEKVPESEL